MVSTLLALVLAVVGTFSADLPGAVASTPPARAAAPLAGRIVVIDPGHQLGNSRHLAQIDRLVWIGNGRKPCNTTGTATHAGYPEATFAWRVAQRMKRRLEGLGARVILTRPANSTALWGPCVDVRGRRGNAVHADAKISIHGDGSYAAGAHGFHVIYAPDNGLTADTYRASRALALDTRAALGRAGFARANYVAGGDGLDVRSDLGTLNLSDMATVMVECGNMRNAADAARMTSAHGQRRYARALVRGVRSYLAAR
ncbi:N-acetylmuramoyl-L-alanine amidase [Nocardioides sp. BP30]|uniref:N-acetylmuramoyl-L-alanine amidase family protein n=1 Tax=Nocardioides sp. BP30 TaxID=3036374 RepID=UPI002468C5D5|nr:N-acetylmuramoyl-L-alanine amidase [Nocardioides sp. BP30]WGL53074.1 N-acetylmuramoyl-L-alanine amidase [Nocardioides sp. BP30]